MHFYGSTNTTKIANDMGRGCTKIDVYHYRCREKFKTSELLLQAYIVRHKLDKVKMCLVAIFLSPFPKKILSIEICVKEIIGRLTQKLYKTVDFSRRCQIFVRRNRLCDIYSIRYLIQLDYKSKIVFIFISSFCKSKLVKLC